ncbi:MAG TPA: patatin-like phospholipase family protein [Mycobacterium sp.]|uniref:patatin-like phospholipase family protein n=1 Tax=Mycobacterium sp. TaxID=1785 RepID=UPI002B9F32D0|nr:patatin-like phospholipase family protein [Mycobacterium sp.]HME74733.1 patatin-like phospholipase family protein [Mycobacterium sp.]
MPEVSRQATQETVDDAPEVLDLPSTPPPAGIGLCLSGGGYRAMLFHLGAVRRLNETGWLARLTRIASVSGGSIIAGKLGMEWKNLTFDQNVAINFDALVEKPILDLAAHTIDVPAVLGALLLPGRISQHVQSAYDRRLFRGATLQDLPHDGDGPRFVLLATNLTHGTLWRFSQPYMRDWKTPEISKPAIPLAQAVAASSAFPPVLSPSLLRLPGGGTVQLTDGGVYDNLGLEPVVKNCATVFVSDGGGTFNEHLVPQKNWIQGTLRVLSTIDVQVRRLRRRQINGMLAAGQRRGAFFAINTDYARFPNSSSRLPAALTATKELAGTKTRLARLDPVRSRRLVNWGYAACDAALRSYVDPKLTQPPGFPYPKEAL